MHDAHVHETPCKCGSQTPGVLHRVFLSYSSFGLLLLPISDQPSDLSCCCCVFFTMQAPPTLLSQVGKSAILGFLEMSEVVSGSWCIYCEICFSHLIVLCLFVL